MNKMMRYGLYALVSISMLGCRENSEDYFVKGLYSGYSIYSRHDGMGYTFSMADTISGARILVEHIRPYSNELMHVPMNIKVYRPLPENMHSYVNLDSLIKIDESLRRSHNIE